MRKFALMGAALAAIMIGSVPAFADTLTVETFTGASVSDPSAWVAGGDGFNFPGWPGKACLTAGSDESQSPIPGCDDPAIDPVGSGVLRVNTNTGGNQGFALFQNALPTSGGLDITFDQAQWGTTSVPGDGLAFFLVDGDTTLTHPGGGGGNLGYSGGGRQGVDNGLIGVGLDSWGNYSIPAAAPIGCGAPGSGVGQSGASPSGPGFTNDRVVIRGPGNGTTGYCWLGSSDTLPELSGATRAESTHVVRIVVDPDTVVGTRNVTVYLDGSQVVQIPAPDELLAADTFKFGFSGSIGAANDNHDIWNLNIESVNPITPVTPVTPDTPVTPAQPVAVTPAFTG
jgi:hypothetical protein